jgi:hypothetical protein
VGVIVRRDNGLGTAIKGNDGDGWSSDGVVLWLGRRQNGDTVEWWREWLRLRWPSYSSEEWESGHPGRVAGGGGADSMLQYWLERGGDGMKHYWKMKQRQRARLGYMGRKCDMAWWHHNVRRRRGGNGEGKGRRWCQLDWCESYWAKKWRKFMRSIQLL